MNLPAQVAGCPVHTELGALGAHEATALTLGRFDGVHEGHRALLRATVDAAQESPGTRAVAVTLWPPPEWILRPAQPRALLTTLHDRLALMAASGVDAIVVLTFDQDFAQQEPREFLSRLRDEAGMRDMVSGPNARIGKGGAGTPPVLRGLSHELGFRYLKEGSPQAALGQFHAAVQADGGDKRSRLAIAVIQAEHGRLTEALEEFEAAVAIDPDFAEAHFQRGLALERAGQAGDAVASYHQALRSAPDLIPAMYALSGALRNRGDTLGARRLLERVVGESPDFTEAIVNLALLLQREGKAREAAKHLARATEQEPDNPRARLALGIVLAELDDMPGAVSSLRAAVKLQPDNPDTHYNLGLALAKDHAPEEAIPLFRAALAVNPRYPGARRALGAALQQSGDLIGAAQELEQAVQDFEGDSDARNTLGATLLRLKDLDGAIRQLEEALRRSPLLVKAHRNLAQAYQRAGRNAEALAASEQSEKAAARQARSGRAILLVQQGKKLLEDGDASAAAESFHEAAEINPDSEDAHLYYGIALWRSRGDVTGSLRSIDRGLQINPRRAEAHYRRGLLLEASDRRDEAMASLRVAVDLAPSLEAAQRSLAGLALEAGDLEVAAQAIAAVLAWHPDDQAAQRLQAQIREQMAR